MQESRGGYSWVGKSAGQAQSGQSLKHKWGGEKERVLVSSFSRLEENIHGGSQSQDTNALLDELENHPKPPKRDASDKIDSQITKYINENEILKKKNVGSSHLGKDRPRAQRAGRTSLPSREVAQRQALTALAYRRAVFDPSIRARPSLRPKRTLISTGSDGERTADQPTAV